MLNNILLFLLYLWGFNLYAETIEGEISSPINSVKINGVIDVQLHTNSEKNYFKISYDSDKNSKVTLNNKEDVLYVQSDGKFHNKPSIEINLINLLEYTTNGINNSVLYINSDKSLIIDLNGVNQAKIIGYSASLIFRLSGTSNINIIDYSATEIAGYLKGISSIYANKLTPLKITKQGISKIYYYP
jgi:hypothetical protein